ncbi:hypothetical protein [Xenorhabdus sp. KJ12.1]|uniref:hypothetical protein n=1 Tax=Xenorhabdus sp. KJ12.1 TaxID=1851571 RepID=UPI000C03BAE8|nr:hypothetical protein [Xenorhabdus sp. KJ12.1]PHM72380.1 hypothetical protein Xekj_00659 [Xenorhabdus sp. KJ12.1]
MNKNSVESIPMMTLCEIISREGTISFKALISLWSTYSEEDFPGLDLYDLRKENVITWDNDRPRQVHAATVTEIHASSVISWLGVSEQSHLDLGLFAPYRT